jgi:hypothetical protein
MPSTIAAALSITLAICSPFVTVQAAAPTAFTRLIVLSRSLALVRVWNNALTHPAREYRSEERLIKLENIALSVKSSLTSGDALKLAQSRLNSGAMGTFSKKRPLPPVFITTLTVVLELAFEGHPNTRIASP